ncbi:E3 ubiquitin-protein ligase TRIM45-like [Mytilus edulis]|uniref:E3 ubiquitin-protein ligase TRIM45-like n=1 Tax=Mytilus edulis TaxID=6550 RepID=UPI0039F0DE74
MEFRRFLEEKIQLIKESQPTTEVKVLYDFDGDPDNGELSVRAGEELTVTAQDIGDGWWEVRNSLGHQGIVPEAYVQKYSRFEEFPPGPLPESPSTTEISSTLTFSPQTSIEKCVFCGNKGIYFCYDCKSSFCKPCRDTHDKPLPSKKHTVTDLKSVNPSAVKLMCELHKSEYTFYCIPCNILVCNTCITSDHKEHGLSGIIEKSDEIKRLAKSKLSDMKDKLQRISKLAEKTKMVNIPELDEESGAAIARIRHVSKDLQKLIETKTDIKVNEVGDATKWKKEELQSAWKNKERIHRKQTAVYESLKTLLSEEHAVSFLVSYQTLKRDMCDLTSEAKDVIEPYHIEAPDLKGFIDETIHSLQEYRTK